MKFLLLLGLLGVGNRTPADPYDLTQVVSAMSFAGVSAPYGWEDCGQRNAYYFPAERRIILCNELRGHITPGILHFYLAHEMSHAVIHQLHIPFTGSEEVAADELAALVLSLDGMARDVAETGSMFLDQARPEIPWDPHPGDVRRGVTLLCMYAGSQHTQLSLCDNQWPQAVYTWTTLLGLGNP